MISLRQPYDCERQLRCEARRGLRGRVRCEKYALHDSHEHAGRSRNGAWFIWTSRSFNG